MRAGAVADLPVRRCRACRVRRIGAVFGAFGDENDRVEFYAVAHEDHCIAASKSKSAATG